MTENGWPPDTNFVTAISLDDCELRTIPGTTLQLWFQKGIPANILTAFFADLNRYVESANNARGYTDEGSWTNGNSVKSSNHNGATAFDYNWFDHPMGPKVPDPNAGWQGSDITGGQPEEPRIRELLAFYTYKGIQLVWWGNDWDSPNDSMHFQMGYNTFQNQDVCQEWIDLHIDKRTGFSDFIASRPTKTPAQVLFSATGLNMDVINEILPTLQQGLILAQCNTVNRIAMKIAQERHESAQFSTTREFGQGAGKPYYPYYGRCWLQVTWESNYQKFGNWCAQRGLIEDPNQFVNNPDSLADLQWAAIGGAWFWLAVHDGHNMINDDCDSDDVEAVTYTINGGYTGLDERTAYYEQAKAVGDDLLILVNQTGEGDVMAGVNIEGLNQVIDKLLTVWPSRSIYRDSDDPVEDIPGYVLNIDGSVHELRVENSALLGDPKALAVIKRTADGLAVEKHPDAIKRAQFVYSKATALNVPIKTVAKKAPAKRAPKKAVK